MTPRTLYLSIQRLPPGQNDSPGTLYPRIQWLSERCILGYSDTQNCILDYPWHSDSPDSMIANPRENIPAQYTLFACMHLSVHSSLHDGPKTNVSRLCAAVVRLSTAHQCSVEGNIVSLARWKLFNGLLIGTSSDIHRKLGQYLRWCAVFFNWSYRNLPSAWLHRSLQLFESIFRYVRKHAVQHMSHSSPSVKPIY